MAAAAVEAGLPEEQDIAIDMELQRLQMLSRVLATRHLEDNPASEGELRAAYEAERRATVRAAVQGTAHSRRRGIGSGGNY